jgi:hypothetical protein
MDGEKRGNKPHMITTFHQSRPVPPEWQRELERHWPRSDRVTWLKLVWEPGFKVRGSDQHVVYPVQRWVIYEMVPQKDFVPFEILDDLRDRSPRVRGHDYEDSGLRGWVSESLVSRTQWELYRETGQYGRRLWIVQGVCGGHPEALSDNEREFLEMRGRGDLELPEPGDLPYAEFDQRVVHRLLGLDKLLKWDQNITWDQRSERKSKAGMWIRRDRVKEEMTFNAMLLDYMDKTIEGLTRDLSHKAMSDIVEYANPELPAFREDTEAADAEFVATTAH